MAVTVDSGIRALQFLWIGLFLLLFLLLFIPVWGHHRFSRLLGSRGDVGPPELHWRFVSGLQKLRGSQGKKLIFCLLLFIQPKQIRELMQVDGLTNDEVKSHLQVSF